MSRLQPVRNRRVIIEYEYEQIIPVLDKILKKYYPNEMYIEDITGSTVTVWIKSWAHLELLRIASYCAEAEALNIQPRPKADYPLTSE